MKYNLENQTLIGLLIDDNENLLEPLWLGLAQFPTFLLDYPLSAFQDNSG